MCARTPSRSRRARALTRVYGLGRPNRKADNPILYASDGFVKVTGYARADVIPRNCRFLQGKYTDRAAVRRLKIAIDHGQESVELLLNYKKSGDPFWNLLYVGESDTFSPPSPGGSSPPPTWDGGKEEERHDLQHPMR